MPSPFYTRKSWNFDINDDGSLIAVGLPFLSMFGEGETERATNGGLVTYTDDGLNFIESSYIRNNLDTSVTPVSGTQMGYSVSLNGRGDRLAVISKSNENGSGIFHVFESGWNGGCNYANFWHTLSQADLGNYIDIPHAKIQMDTSGNTLITSRSNFNCWVGNQTTDRVNVYSYDKDYCGDGEWGWYLSSLVTETYDKQDLYDNLGHHAAISGSGDKVVSTFNSKWMVNGSGTYHQYAEVYVVKGDRQSSASGVTSGWETRKDVICEDYLTQGECLSQRVNGVWSSGDACTDVTCIKADIEPCQNTTADPSATTTFNPTTTTKTTASTTTTPTTTTTTTTTTNPAENCCNWNGAATWIAQIAGVADDACAFSQAFQTTLITDNATQKIWEFDGNLACGDYLYIKYKCNKNVDLGDESTIYLDPISDGDIFDWSGSYADIDDGVRAPDTPGGDNIYSSSEGQIARVNVEDIPSTNTTATSVRLWLYSAQGEPEPARIRLGGTWYLEVSQKTGGSSEWDYFEWNVNIDLSSGLTDNGFEIKCGPAEDDEVPAAYLEVITSDGNVDDKWEVMEVNYTCPINFQVTSESTGGCDTPPSLTWTGSSANAFCDCCASK